MEIERKLMYYLSGLVTKLNVLHYFLLWRVDSKFYFPSQNFTFLGVVLISPYHVYLF